MYCKFRKKKSEKLMSMLQLTAGNKITEVCTPSGHSGSLQKVPLRPVDWMNCGFGQPSDFADFFGTCLQSLRDWKSIEAQTFGCSQGHLKLATTVVQCLNQHVPLCSQPPFPAHYLVIYLMSQPTCVSKQLVAVQLLLQFKHQVVYCIMKEHVLQKKQQQ